MPLTEIDEGSEEARVAVVNQRQDQADQLTKLQQRAHEHQGYGQINWVAAKRDKQDGFQANSTSDGSDAEG